ncbi:MAG: HRDC domain-containing protein, partial [Planctomycetota bacterium]
QDMEIFFLEGDAVPRNVFDTQVAAALVGYGESIGYSKLVLAAFEERLGKGQTFTDWSRRPLTKEQVAYALDDVRYLIPLYDSLSESIGKHEREQWLADELCRFEETEYYRRSADTAFRKVKGAGSLSDAELAILREIAGWREVEAEERDKPRSRIISDSLMIEISKRKPKNGDQLAGLRGLHPRLLKRSGRDLMACVERGLACSPEDYPVIQRKVRDEKLSALVNLMEIIVGVRSAESRVGASYLCGRSELHLVAQSPNPSEDQDLRVFRGWRREVVGEDLLALLRGEIVVTVNPETRDVELHSEA